MTSFYTLLNTKYQIHFFALLLFVFSTTPILQAQTVNFVADYAAPGQICSAGNGCFANTGDSVGETFDCLVPTPLGNIDAFPFTDPVPPGNMVTGVSIDLYGECSPNNTTYAINGELVQTQNLGTVGPCSCVCNPVSTFTATYPGGLTGYNYGGANTLDLSISGSALCAYYAEVTLTYAPAGPPPPATVPTLGQWGIILFTLLLLTLSVVTLVQRQTTTASVSGNASLNPRQVPFNRGLFMRLLAGVLMAAFVLFGAAIAMFGYELTSADVPGTLVCAPILAYLMSLAWVKK